jgi:Tol biopolymer transport system component
VTVQAAGYLFRTRVAAKTPQRRILDEGDGNGMTGRSRKTARRWLVASMGFVVGVMAPVGAVVPGGNGAIAFTSTVAGNSDIAVLDPCGATRSLIAGPTADLRPVWSPDGRRIAFMSNRDGDFEIHVANADGSNVVALTDHPDNDFNPTWSPDGRRIAWNSDRTGDFEIYVMRSDGTDVRQLTDTPGIDSVPSWSPRGDRIAFESNRDGNAEVYVMDADGGDQRNLSKNAPANDTNPAWSPEGRRLAFTSDRGVDLDLFVMRVDGSRLVNLTRDPAEDRNPAWSPDGAQIAFASDRSGAFHLYAMRPDGSRVTELTDGARDTIPDWQRFPGRGEPPPSCRHPAGPAGPEN